MQSLTYQHNTGFVPAAMINRAQTKQDHDHELIRDAVRAWASAIDNQDVVSALIINEYREQGGDSISFPDDISRARQKLFRFLDNRINSGETIPDPVKQLPVLGGKPLSRMQGLARLAEIREKHGLRGRKQ